MAETIEKGLSTEAIKILSLLADNVSKEPSLVVPLKTISEDQEVKKGLIKLRDAMGKAQKKPSPPPPVSPSPEDIAMDQAMMAAAVAESLEDAKGKPEVGKPEVGKPEVGKPAGADKPKQPGAAENAALKAAFDNAFEVARDAENKRNLAKIKAQQAVDVDAKTRAEEELMNAEQKLDQAKTSLNEARLKKEAAAQGGRNRRTKKTNYYRKRRRSRRGRSRRSRSRRRRSRRN